MKPANGRKNRKAWAKTAISKAALKEYGQQRYLCEQLESRRMLDGMIDFGIAADTVHSRLDAVQSTVDSAFAGAASIPILGSQLLQAVPSIGNLVGQLDQIGNKLAVLGSRPIDNGLIAPIQDALYPFLSGGLLQDTNSNGVDKGDILVSPAADGSSVGIHVRLGETLLNVSNSSKFGLNLGKLMSFDAPSGEKIDLTLGYDLSFHISAGTPSSPSVVTLDSAATPLTITATATIPNMTLHGNLGFLGFSAQDKDGGSHFAASFGFGLDAQGGLSSFTLTGDAVLKLELGLTLQSDPDSVSSQPMFSSEFNLGWHFDHNVIGQDPTSFGTLTQLSFDHVSVDLHQLLPGFVQDVVGDVQSFVKPLFPFLDFINKPIPGLSDIGINTTVRDLLNKGGMISGSVSNILDALTFIRNLSVNPSVNGLPLDLGSFSLLDGNSTLSDAINGTFANPNANSAAIGNDILTKANAATGGFFNSIGTKIASNGIDDPTAYGLQFPILTDPAGSVFKLFLGMDADLFTYRMPPTISQFGAAVSFGIPILASVRLAAGIQFQGDLSVGYDTEGVKEFLASGKLADLRKGFYINNTVSDAQDPLGEPYKHFATGIDVHGFMSADLEVLLLKVSGGLYANASLHLDPRLNDSKGRVRLDQLWDTITSNPLHLFATSGQIYASIDAGAGFDTPFGDVTLFSFNVGRAILVDWDTSPAPPPPLSGGDIPPTTIYLHMTAGNDHIVVSDYQKSYSDSISGELTTDYGIEVIYPDHTETYRTRIWRHDEGLFNSNFPAINLIAQDGDSGGNDTVLIEQVDADGGYGGTGNDPVTTVLIGGSGDDNFENDGNGKALLVGEGGNDRLVGGQIEYGGQGNFSALLASDWASPFAFAVLSANVGAVLTDDSSQFDLLIGTSGADALYGGQGHNTFYGQGGADIEQGNTGDDVFVVSFEDGGNGSLFYGGGGNDTVHVDGRSAIPTLGDPIAPSRTLTVSSSAAILDALDNKNATVIGYGSNQYVARDLSSLSFYSQGDQNTVVINDLSATSLKGVYLDVSQGNAFQVADSVKIIGSAINDYYMVQTTASAFGASAVDVADNSSIPFHVVIEGLDNLDKLTLDGAHGLDFYTVKLNTADNFDTTVQDSGGDHSTITVDGTAFATGDHNVGISVADLFSGAPAMTQITFRGEYGDPLHSLLTVSATVSYALYADVTVNLLGADGAGGTHNDWSIDTQSTTHMSIVGGNGGDTFNLLGSGGTLDVYGGAGDDTFNAFASPKLLLDGSDGNDTYNIAMGLANAPWTITDTGTSGIDSLSVDDSANELVVQADYYISGNNITRIDSDDPGFPSFVSQVSFSPMGHVTLDTGRGDYGGNSIHMDSSAPGSVTTINTGPEANRVLLGGVDQDLGLFGGSVTVNGQPGTTLSVEDESAASDSVTYTLLDGSLVGFRNIIDPNTGRLKFIAVTAPIGFSNVDSFALLTAAGSTSDVVYVLATGGAGQEILNTAASTAAIIVGDANDNLNTVGNLRINGGPSTTLLINDQANANRKFNIVDPLSKKITYRVSEVTQPVFLVTSTGVTRTNPVGDTYVPAVKPIDPGEPLVVNHTYAMNLTYSNISTMTIDGGGSQNVFNVQSTVSGPAVTLNGGGNGDVFNVGSIAVSATSITGMNGIGTLTINGGAGSVVNLDDRTNANTIINPNSPDAKRLQTNPVFQIEATEVTRSAGLVITSLADGTVLPSHDIFSTVYYVADQLNIYGGPTSNTYNVESTLSPVAIYAGNDNDMVNAGGPNHLMDPVGQLTVMGGGGTILNIDDQANADQQIQGVNEIVKSKPEYAVTDSHVSRVNHLQYFNSTTNALIKANDLIASLDFSNLASLVILGGTTADTINVEATAVGTSVTVDGGSGDDIIHVGSLGNMLDPIQSPLTVNGQSGFDTLNINDQGTTTSEYYVVTDSSVRRALNTNPLGDFTQTINFTSIEKLSLNAGSGSNGFDLQAADPGIPLIIDGGVPIFVTNTSDSGPGSLRAAIIAANSRALSRSTILFNIPKTDPNFSAGSRAFTITPLSVLPAITSPVTIDGYSQSGAKVNNLSGGDNATPLIELTGISVGQDGGFAFGVEGLELAAAGSVVRGLVINDWLDAEILVDGAGQTIAGNFLGTDITGTIAKTRGNAIGGSRSGVRFVNAPAGSTIGGTSPADRNIISGNGGSGIALLSTSGILIEGNFIGIDRSGTIALGNGAHGLDLSGNTSNNTIGGTIPGAGNLISANLSSGISIANGMLYNNLIQGNSIGTDVTGTAPLGNHRFGVEINSTGPASSVGTIIGGTTFGVKSIDGTTIGGGNLIAASGAYGISIFRSSGNDVIDGNFIGSNASGTASLANAYGGIDLVTTSLVNIGGAAKGLGNLISGNHGNGIDIYNGGDVQIQGNLIGTDITGLAPLKNDNNGIRLESTWNDTIGGADPGMGNTIAFNGGTYDIPTGDGILGFIGATGIAIESNSIFSNYLLGIDLDGGGARAGDGVTPNDTGDGDTGPNNLQNYPVLTSVSINAGEAVIEGTINSTKGSTFRIELFGNAIANASGHGEGQFALGSVPVTTSLDGYGSFSFTLPISMLVGTTALSATATDAAGNTSEFSANLTAPVIQYTRTTITGPPGNTAVYGTATTFVAAVTAANGTIAPTAGKVDFFDVSTNIDLGLGTLGSSSGLTTLWSYTTPAKQFNVTAGDVIQASYTTDTGFVGSSGVVTEIVTPRPITVTAASSSKQYDGSVSAFPIPVITSGSLAVGDTANFMEIYDTPATGSGKTLTPSGAVNDGNSGGNYDVTFVSTTTGTILIDQLVFQGGQPKVSIGLPPSFSAGLQATDLTIFDLDNNTLLKPPGETLGWDPVLNTATWTFNNLPDADYHATLLATPANQLTQDFNLDFWSLRGDANLDRSVGFADLVAVAQHYGNSSGQALAMGDVDGDGTVSFADLVAVAQNYGKYLAPPPMAATAIAAMTLAAVAVPPASAPVATLTAVEAAIPAPTHGSNAKPKVTVATFAKFLTKPLAPLKPKTAAVQPRSPFSISRIAETKRRNDLLD